MPLSSPSAPPYGRPVDSGERETDRPATFIVERYWPGIDEAGLRAALPRLDGAVHFLAGEGFSLANLGSILMPADEVVFSLISARSESVVRRANELAGLPVDRVSAAITVFPPADGIIEPALEGNENASSKSDVGGTRHTSG
jgi:hypothetical protein